MLTFESNQFDLTTEPPNELNPIFGYSLGELLRKNLAQKGHITNDEVNSEDWGWYFYITFNGHRYMIGTSAYVDTDPITEKPILTDEPIEFLIHLKKLRKFKEKLLRQNKMSLNDPIFEEIEMVLKENIGDMKNLSRET